MNEVAYYEAFEPITDEWVGTAPLKTIERYGLVADRRYPLFGDESLCDEHGWACKAK
jgi:hypothetical protein